MGICIGTTHYSPYSQPASQPAYEETDYSQLKARDHSLLEGGEETGQERGGAPSRGQSWHHVVIYGEIHPVPAVARREGEEQPRKDLTITGQKVRATLSMPYQNHAGSAELAVQLLRGRGRIIQVGSGVRSQGANYHHLPVS